MNIGKRDQTTIDPASDLHGEPYKLITIWF